MYRHTAPLHRYTLEQECVELYSRETLHYARGCCRLKGPLISAAVQPRSLSSLSPSPCHKKSIGFKIAEERARLILNGFQQPSLSLCPCEVWWQRYSVRVPLTSDTWPQWGTSWDFWCDRFHDVRLVLFPLCFKRRNKVDRHWLRVYSNVLHSLGTKKKLQLSNYLICISPSLE